MRFLLFAFAFAAGCSSASSGPTKCPVAVPKDMSACDSSGGDAKCTYDCAAGHGIVSYATCANSRWSVEQSGVNCPACSLTDPETCEAGTK